MFISSVHGPDSSLSQLFILVVLNQKVSSDVKWHCDPCLSVSANSLSRKHVLSVKSSTLLAIWFLSGTSPTVVHAGKMAEVWKMKYSLMCCDPSYWTAVFFCAATNISTLEWSDFPVCVASLAKYYLYIPKVLQNKFSEIITDWFVLYLQINTKFWE